MKQVLQSLRNGITTVADVPSPSISDGEVLIATSHSLISAGTERMLVEFGKSGWINKARQHPDKVKMVLEKIRTDGILATASSVLHKLDQPLPLGYSNVGRVVKVGRNVSGFRVGDRVVSNGRHAELVAVPVNLCAKVPDGVSDGDAAFCVLGAIALQGIRLVQPTLGETVAVFGLGLVGLLTVQLLRANGCRVLGLDFSPQRLEMAREFGAEVVDLSSGQDPVTAAVAFSRGRGVDAVVIAAATTSNDPVHQAALMCRKRGRIVLVGVTGLKLSREDFYQKELSFQVSSSYGPGRYDPSYEKKGIDYPIGFVRWTQKRNFEAVLDLLAEGRICVTPLVSHRFSITQAEAAYQIIGSEQDSLGILLTYSSGEEGNDSGTISLPSLGSSQRKTNSGSGLIGSNPYGLSFIGAGGYAASVLIPAFKATKFKFRNVASRSGVGAFHSAKKFGFEFATTDLEQIFHDENTHAIVIATPHDSHASLVKRAILSRKAVFVEKPLCITLHELQEIELAVNSIRLDGVEPLLMVGFNRRFSPHVEKIKSLISPIVLPKCFVLTVNAGQVPSDHWIQDRQIGGGRVIGEFCHFLDLLRYLSNCRVVGWNKTAIPAQGGDSFSVTLRFADHSVGVINYFANGAKSFPKEHLEIFADGRVIQMVNYRSMRGFGWPNFRSMNLWRQDKGQSGCANAFASAVRGGLAPIPLDEIFEVSRLAIEIADQELA